MTTLITADLHLSDNPRDDYRHQFMRELPALASSLHADVALLLGDFTEEKDRHRAWLVNQVVGHVAALAKKALVVCLCGNHDYLDVESPFYEFLKQVPGVVWINAPTPAENLPHSFAERLAGSLFLPHTPNYKRDWAGIDFSRYRRVFAHQSFAGAAGGYGDLIPTDIFPAGVGVISGDIHIPQTVGPVRYVGAPYRVDFGDDYDPRMLLITDQDKLKSIPCDGPQKRLIEIGNVRDLSKQRDLMRGDILKVRVHLSADEHAEWHTIKDKVREWADKKGFVLHQVQPQVERVLDLSKPTKTKRIAGDAEMVQRYAKVRDVDERTLKTGLALLEQL